VFDKYFLYETDGFVSLFSCENEGMWFAVSGKLEWHFLHVIEGFVTHYSCETDGLGFIARMLES
jgi:hypothetical protein